MVAHTQRSKKDVSAVTIMDGSVLPAIDPLPSRNAISKAPRAAAIAVAISSFGTGPTKLRGAATQSASGGPTDYVGGVNAALICGCL